MQKSRNLRLTQTVQTQLTSDKTSWITVVNKPWPLYLLIAVYACLCLQHKDSNTSLKVMLW